MISVFSEQSTLKFNPEIYLAYNEDLKDTIVTKFYTRMLDIRGLKINNKKNEAFLKDIRATKGDFLKFKDDVSFRKFLSYNNSTTNKTFHELVTATQLLRKNLVDNRKTFMKLYRDEHYKPLRLYYEGWVLAYIMSIVILSSTYYAFIEDKMTHAVNIVEIPNNAVDPVKEARAKRHLDYINKINEQVRKQKLEKIISSFDDYYGIKNEDLLSTGMAVLAAGPSVVFGAVAAAIIILVCIRTIISYYYELRVSVADYLRATAEMLDNNVTTITDERTKKKQRDKADKYRELANKLDLDLNVAENRSERELAKISSEVGKDSLRQNSDSISSDSSYSRSNYII